MVYGQKLKKIFINLICLPVLNKKLRHKIRYILNDFSIFTPYYYLKFMHHWVKQGSILIVEPNICHGEVIPGIVKYFQDLGYKNIVLLIRDGTKNENPFCKMDNNFRVFQFNPSFFSKARCIKKIGKFKTVFLTSSVIYSNEHISLFSLYPRLLNLKNLLFISHDLSEYDKNKKIFSTKQPLIMLGNFKNAIQINPHYFGKILVTEKNQHKTIFLSVGALVPFRRNFDLLLSSTMELIKYSKNFQIYVIGSGKVKNIPLELQPFIKILGRLTFEDMFKNIENADFILPLLDPENKDQDRYITSGVTGTAQLIYGFRKIPIIHKKFADFYEFNEENSIIYDAKNMAKSMLYAIKMSEKEYKRKQDNLKETSDNIYTNSLQNLKELIK